MKEKKLVNKFSIWEMKAIEDNASISHLCLQSAGKTASRMIILHFYILNGLMLQLSYCDFIHIYVVKSM